MRKIMVVLFMMFSTTTFASNPCARVENFILLGGFAGQCNADVKKGGSSAMKTSKACAATEKYNQQAGMASIAVMVSTTPNLYVQCMNKYMQEFSKAESALEVWSTNSNKGLTQDQINERAIKQMMGQ